MRSTLAICILFSSLVGGAWVYADDELAFSIHFGVMFTEVYEWTTETELEAVEEFFDAHMSSQGSWDSAKFRPSTRYLAEVSELSQTVRIGEESVMVSDLKGETTYAAEIKRLPFQNRILKLTVPADKIEEYVRTKMDRLAARVLEEDEVDPEDDRLRKEMVTGEFVCERPLSVLRKSKDLVKCTVFAVMEISSSEIDVKALQDRLQSKEFKWLFARVLK